MQEIWTWRWYNWFYWSRPSTSNWWYLFGPAGLGFCQESEGKSLYLIFSSYFHALWQASTNVEYNAVDHNTLQKIHSFYTCIWSVTTLEMWIQPQQQRKQHKKFKLPIKPLFWSCMVYIVVYVLEQFHLILPTEYKVHWKLLSRTTYNTFIFLFS